MFAAIDAGSNTLRLLIGTVVDQKVVPYTYQRNICRLAGGFSEGEGLSSEARERTLSVFHHFSKTCRSSGVEKVAAVGTAAFRRAANGEWFARQVARATGLPLKIIDGEKEAHYMALGVLSVLNPAPDHTLIIDIGGGSTELVFCVKGKVFWMQSYPLGVVRLVEDCSTSAEQCKVIADAVALIQADILSQCDKAGIEPAQLSLVGTAGTVTSLAALDMQMDIYDWKRVNNYSMSYTALLSWHDRLKPLSAMQREALPGMEPGRGDLILAGLDIVLFLMQALKSPLLTVSDFGLLEGLLLSMQAPEKS